MLTGSVRISGSISREHFDDGQIIEIAAVIGLFNYFNRFNDALKVDITRPPATGANESDQG